MEESYITFRNENKVELMGFLMSDIMGIQGAIVNGVEISITVIPNTDNIARFFSCLFWLCIMHCVVLGNVVRWCVSSLLGSYIHQELLSCSIGTVFNNVNNTNVFSCIES